MNAVVEPTQGSAEKFLEMVKNLEKDLNSLQQQPQQMTIETVKVVEEKSLIPQTKEKAVVVTRKRKKTKEDNEKKNKKKKN